MLYVKHQKSKLVCVRSKAKISKQKGSRGENRYKFEVTLEIDIEGFQQKIFEFKIQSE